MKISAISIFFFFFFYSKLFASENCKLAHLEYVNQEWPKQKDVGAIVDKLELADGLTYADWIKTHLQLVEKILRGRSLEGLSHTQIINRLKCLDNLHRYWLAGKFPINDYVSYKTPVFIDRKGTHCAVGYLMMSSGVDKLAQQIDRQQKFAYVTEIKVRGVKEWALKNGFTLDELAWIQPTYPCTHPACPTEEVRNVSCYGAGDGCIGLPNTTGFISPMAVIFYPGHDTVPTWNQNPCDLTPGDYTYQITDGLGVNHYFYYTITQPDSIEASAIATPSCYGQNNGSINLLLGKDSASYAFLWSDSAVTRNITGLDSGFYSVIISDTNNCNKSLFITLAQDDSITVWVATTSDEGGCNGSALISAHGGGGEYIYTLNGMALADSLINGLCSGDYTVMVTDNDGCSKTETFTINLNTAISGIESGLVAFIFPNPAFQFTEIKTASKIDKVKVTDLSGREMVLGCIQNKIDVSGLEPGVYVAQFWAGNIVAQRRFLKL